MNAVLDCGVKTIISLLIMMNYMWFTQIDELLYYLCDIVMLFMCTQMRMRCRYIWIRRRYSNPALWLGRVFCLTGRLRRRKVMYKSCSGHVPRDKWILCLAWRVSMTVEDILSVWVMFPSSWDIRVMEFHFCLWEMTSVGDFASISVSVGHRTTNNWCCSLL